MHCPADSEQCANCGAGLQHVRPYQEGGGAWAPEQSGLADLAESRLRWRGGTFLTLLLLVAAFLLCALLSLQLFQWLQGNNLIPSAQAARPTASATATASATPGPTLFLPTVTLTPSPPPSATFTPTRSPCQQLVRGGDSLVALVARCGHRDLDVIDLVLEINGLAAAERIQIGQQLEIPWPTSTAAAQQLASPPAAREATRVPGAAGSTGPAPSPFSAGPAQVTPTLQAGVQWHRVSAGETIVGLAYRYGTDLKVLSELNPEVTFSQCDFGQASGGPGCVVMVYENQRLRVPAPTPTPTLSPTISNIATTTPTPVINAPAAYSPPDEHNFGSDEIVTLRWVATGSLQAGQSWRVVVESLSSGQVFSLATSAQSLVVPGEWQEQLPGWHGYRWRVQLVSEDSQTVRESETRVFLWESAP